jgi:hypothetical protein
MELAQELYADRRPIDDRHPPNSRGDMRAASSPNLEEQWRLAGHQSCRIACGQERGGRATADTVVGQDRPPVDCVTAPICHSRRRIAKAADGLQGS